MKMNKLATAIAVSMPLLFGAAHAQTTTSPDTGKNRSSDAGAMSGNPTPATGSSTSAASGNTATSGNAGNAGSPTNSAASSNTGSASDTTSTTGGGVPTGTAGGAATGTSASGAATGTSTMPGQGTAADATSRSPGATAAGGDAAASTEAITGWSVKDDIIGKSVHNENDEKVGDVNDVVVSSDGRSMFLLIGAGGFLGMGEKNVAVPFDRFKRSEDRILLSGYSKEQLKALPEVRTER